MTNSYHIIFTVYLSRNFNKSSSAFPFYSDPPAALLFDDGPSSLQENLMRKFMFKLKPVVWYAQRLQPASPLKTPVARPTAVHKRFALMGGLLAARVRLTKDDGTKDDGTWEGLTRDDGTWKDDLVDMAKNQLNDTILSKLYPNFIPIQRPDSTPHKSAIQKGPNVYISDVKENGEDGPLVDTGAPWGSIRDHYELMIHLRVTLRIQTLLPYM